MPFDFGLDDALDAADLLGLRPFSFQRQVLKWLSNRKRAIVALEQGLGKTVVSALDLTPPAVVVCTSAMKFKWKSEIELWRPDLKCQVIRTVKEEIDWSCDVWIINYDILWKYQVPQPHTLIVDEAHKVKNPTAKRSKAVLAIAEHSKRVRYLSGTPMLSRPIELFPMLTSVGAININWKKYGLEFCDGKYMRFGKGEPHFDVSGASNLDLLADLVEPHMIRMTKKEVAPELPPKTYRIIELDGLIKKQEREFLDFYKTNLRLPRNRIAFQAISDIRKEHARRKLPQSIKYIKDRLEEGDQNSKIVVFAHHRETVDGIAEALKDYGAVKVMGGTKPQDAFNSVQAFQTDDRVRVFVGNLQAASEGLTLTAASHVVIAEPSWVPGEIAQAADRCHRFGTVYPVTVDLLCVQGSIDAQMLWVALDKLENIEQVIKETKMPKSKIAELLRELADEFEAAGVGAGAAEEEEAPKRGRRSRSKDEEEDEKPKRGRRSSKKDEEEEEEEDEKPKRGRRSSKKEDEKPKGPTLEKVREKAAEMLAEKLRDELSDLLDEFGASSVSDLKEDQYAEFIEGCDEILEDE